MKNSTTKILLILTVILGITVYTVLDAFMFAPSRIHTRYVTLESEYIPEKLDDMNILFFSDLDYGSFMNADRLDKLVTKINALSPDVIIFGGDLYDTNVVSDEESITKLAEAFSSLNASYGKYAVLGDHDHESEEMFNAVNTIYGRSNFELLNNKAINLHQKTTDSITLVGLDNGINGTQDIETAFSTVSREAYVITVCHTPDTVSLIPQDIANYYLTGHSHGGQAYYLFGSLYEPPGAIEYFRGIHEINATLTLDITNGVGNTISDVRFLADAEVVLYSLHSTTKPTPSPTISAEPTEEPTDTPADIPAEEQPVQEEPVQEEPVEEEQPAEEETPAEEEQATEEEQVNEQEG